VRLVLDASPLNHFARAKRVATLGKMLDEDEAFVTDAVLDELQAGVDRFPELENLPSLEWLRRASVSSRDMLGVFAEYARLLGSGARGVGEAATLAWAECADAVAIVDERAGTRAGKQRGVEVHGSIWLIIRGYRQGHLDRAAAERLVDQLRDSEAWLPCDGTRLFQWATEQGLLDS